jgi:hypothetical protein
MHVRNFVEECNFYGLSVTSAETWRKAAIQSHLQNGRDAHYLENKLETQPPRFVMLGINHGS